jgi:hypothetical protein
MENLMPSVMGAFTEFERSLTWERQREGIALAKQRGACKGRGQNPGRSLQSTKGRFSDYLPLCGSDFLYLRVTTFKTVEDGKKQSAASAYAKL